MKEQVSQIQISQNSKELLQIPIIEKDTQVNILKLKLKYTKTIVICSFVLLSCIYFPYQAIGFYIQSSEDQNEILGSSIFQILGLIISDLIPQLLIGITVDMFSLESSLIFSVVLLIVGIAINILSLVFEEQMIIFSYLLTSFASSCNYICIAYIIYDSAYSLQQRMLNNGLLLIATYFISKLTILTISIFEQLNQLTNIIIDSAAVGFALFCIIMINKQYKKIDQERQKSNLYKNFLKYQGVGITIKAIFEYFNNKHIIYNLIMAFLTSLITSHNFPDFFISILKDKVNNFEEKYQNSINLAYTISFALPGFIIFYYINTRKPLIEYFMKFTSNFLNFSIFIYFTLCIVIYFQERVSNDFLFIAFMIYSIYLGSFHLTTYVIYYQIMFCFMDNRMSIRCIGLSLMSIGQDINLLFFVFNIQPIIFSLCLLLAIILIKIYHEYYIYNKLFDKLETQQNVSLFDQV